MKYPDKSILIIDSGGNYVSEAERFARDFGDVYYFCPNYSGWPSLKKSMFGERLKNVKVIEQWMWKWNDYGKKEGGYEFNKIDLFYFSDVYMGDKQMHLIHDCNKIVWGSRKAEELELLRYETKIKMANIGLAVTPTILCKDYSELMKYLEKENKPKFIKLSWFRGIIESAKFESISNSVNTLSELKKALEESCADEGENAMELIIEEMIDADIEIGIDTVCIDGKIPQEVCWGMEIKDKVYLCKHDSYDNLPERLKDTTHGLLKLISEYGDNGCRSKISTEVMIEKNKTQDGHLVDITIRNPSPNTEIQQEWMENYAEIAYEGANGKLIEPIYKTKYAAQVEIYSLYAKENRQDIKIPDDIKQWVKLKNYCGKKKTGSQEYSVIPVGDLIEIGNIVGIGNTPEECFEKIRSYAEKIEGEHLEIQFAAIEKIEEERKKIKEQLGIEF